MKKSKKHKEKYYLNLETNHCNDINSGTIRHICIIRFTGG